LFVVVGDVVADRLRDGLAGDPLPGPLQDGHAELAGKSDQGGGSTAPCSVKPLPSCGAHTLVACFSGWLNADKYGPQTQIWLDEVSSFSTGQWTGQVQAGGVRYLLQDLPHVTATGDPSVTRGCLASTPALAAGQMLAET
jgi:hypothetical protein